MVRRHILSKSALYSTLALLLSIWPHAAWSAGDGIALKVEPTTVRADIFFSGKRLKISGTVPADCEAVITCKGKDKTFHLKKKGKVWGVLWMSTGDVIFEHMPSLYQVRTTAPLASLASVSILKQWRLGYPALSAVVQRNTDEDGDDNPGAMFDDYIKLKAQEGLYSVQEEVLQASSGAGATRRVEAECTIPARAKMGDYKVQLLAFRSGEVVSHIERPIELKQVRLVRFISSLAAEHGLAHGIFAVMVAIIAGLLTGILFGIKSKKVH